MGRPISGMDTLKSHRIVLQTLYEHCRPRNRKIKYGLRVAINDMVPPDRSESSSSGRRFKVVRLMEEYDLYGVGDALEEQ